jgi:hypothetical protein
MATKHSSHPVALCITASILATCGAQAAESSVNANSPTTAGALSKTTEANTSESWQKPAWVTDLSLGAKESYDDNVLGVSGDGLKPEASWITTISPKVGFNFAPLLGNQKTLQTLSLSYTPDFNFYHDDPSQSYNAHKLGDSINAHNLITYYGEARLTATLTTRQTVTFNYKQWQWVSSTGKVPYFDSTYGLTYHRSTTKPLGVDLGGKILESDYTSGNAITPSGQNSSLRDDLEYSVSIGATYAFTPHFSASLAYTYDIGANGLDNLPASLAPAYREFDHQLVSLGMQYKF